LVLTYAVNYADAIVNCWLLGSESGNAIADVLFGKYNPSAKLPATFPYHLGQVPIYYEQLPTGRPYNPDPYGFGIKYRDVPNTPLFAFGYGLSYTKFAYSNLKLSSASFSMNDSLSITATISNIGDFAGEEVVQLYVRDLVGNGVSRPVMQLKGFEKINIKKGASQTVRFVIYPKDLAFFRLDKSFAPEAGKFELYLASSSDDIRLKGDFVLTD
jgi:beta-glucosidase